MVVFLWEFNFFAFYSWGNLQSYIPGENSIYYDKDLFNSLSEDILLIKEQYDVPICIVGDLNSRTGTLDDFITIDDHVARSIDLDIIDSDMFSSKFNLDNKGFETNRFSKDNVISANGKQLIEMCRATDIKIVNGRFGNDYKTGNFTCHKQNGSSVIDYIIVSPILFEFIENFSVGQMDILFSDVHSPLTISLNVLNKSKQNLNINIGEQD